MLQGKSWKKYVTGLSPTRENPRFLKVTQIVFAICFILGILAANYIEKESHIWNGYFIEQFQFTNIQMGRLFFYILGKRLPSFFLILVLSMTSIGLMAGMAFIGWQGFAGGFLLASATISFGFKGVLLVPAAIFPQYLIYIPLYLASLYLANFSRRHKASRSKSIYAKLVVVALLSLFVYTLGIFLESYINPYILRWALGMF